VRTFTIGFAEAGFDEAEHARAVATHLGTDHTELRMTPEDALALVSGLAEIWDEPFADNSALATALVCRLARTHVTVALTGDGGDELFAGYRYYPNAERRWRRLARRGRWRRGLEATGAELLGQALWRLRLGAPAKEGNVALGAWLLREAKGLRARGPLDLYLKRERQRVADPSGFVLGAAPAASLADELELRLRSEETLRAIRLLDFATWLPDDVLAKLDRASMAVGLEARSPLLDSRVGAFAWRLPPELLVGPEGGKRPLRAVLDRYVPRTITDRPKAGFIVPLRAWLTGPLRGWAEALLDPVRIRREGYLRPEAVTRAWRQLQAGWDRNQNLVWSILVFQLWRERWEAGAASGPAHVLGGSTGQLQVGECHDLAHDQERRSA
jgi:asparagine synthase (glutamine-hydrolysing)